MLADRKVISGENDLGEAEPYKSQGLWYLTALDLV